MKYKKVWLRIPNSDKAILIWIKKSWLKRFIEGFLFGIEKSK
jgi:hypothetical protein